MHTYSAIACTFDLYSYLGTSTPFFHYKRTSHVHLFEWCIIMHMLCRIDWMQSYKNVEPVRPFYIIVATYTFSTTKSKNIPNHNCNAAMVTRPEADFGQGHKHTTHTRTHRCTQEHTHIPPPPSPFYICTCSALGESECNVCLCVVLAWAMSAVYVGRCVCTEKNDMVLIVTHTLGGVVTLTHLECSRQNCSTLWSM